MTEAREYDTQRTDSESAEVKEGRSTVLGRLIG